KETKEEYVLKYQQEVETKTTQTQESQLAMTIGTALIEEQNLSEEEKKVFLEKYSKRIEEECQVSMEDSFSISQTLVNIVPKNPFQPLVNDDMLQVIFLSIMFGLLLAHIQQDKREILEKGIEGLNDTMMIFVTWVMKLAPWGVFALMAKIVSQVGFSILQSLFVYMLVVLSGLVLHMVIVYGSVLWLVARISIITFLKKIKSVILISFSTSSSCATIPVSMNCVEKEFNVTPTISSFVIPLGATINMDGTGLYQGVATIFIAQVYNIPLDIWGQLTIILTATLASIGTAGVPGVGIIILTMVLKSVNVPIEGIALIIGVDRVLDMCRTVLNVMGDLCASVVVQNSEWKREKK
ncbi:MAG TPA: dicarboxylate/amino acid:cation symporter, partial [Planctomycetota bacterium]|nr:dicarboxylate/amino acid:cation symporter [Planctomycetota bacterium]